MNVHDGVKTEIRKRFIEGEGWHIEEVPIGTPVAEGQTVMAAVPAEPAKKVIITIADVPLPLARQVVEAAGLLVVPPSFLNETQLEDLKIDPANVAPPAAKTAEKPSKKLTEAQAVKAVSTAKDFKELNELTGHETRPLVLAAAEQRASELKEQGVQ